MSTDLETLRSALATIPYARFLGLELIHAPTDKAPDRILARLPFQPHLVGNPMIPALHGGVLGAFMELTATTHLAKSEGSLVMPKPINVSIQYLRSGKTKTCYAEAQLNRLGRTIAQIDVRAWQEDEAVPIAQLQAHFLVSKQKS